MSESLSDHEVENLNDSDSDDANQIPDGIIFNTHMAVMSRANSLNLFRVGKQKSPCHLPTSYSALQAVEKFLQWM